MLLNVCKVKETLGTNGKSNVKKIRGDLLVDGQLTIKFKKWFVNICQYFMMVLL